MQPTFFPLFPVTFVDGVPACGCSAGEACEDIGKHPASFWSDLSPGEQRRGPAGHGLVTGAKSGLFVLDVDVKPGKNGFDELAKLGPLPETYAVATPSGGRHFYFAHPGKAVRTSGGALGPGLDIRGDGGYVVMPGSPHRNGGTYTVAANLPVAPAPAWLLNWPGLYGAELRPAGENAPTPIGPEHPQWAYRNRLAIEACSSFAPSREDGEGSANLGKIVKRLVWDLELSPELAAERISTIWDPRCTKADGFTPSPWGAEEIERAIANSLRRDLVPGIAPEGFDLGALVRKPTPAPATERRRTKNPNHLYECADGDTPNGDKRATTFGNIVSILTTHPSWEGVLQYDELKNRIRAVDPPIKLDAEGTGWADHDTDGVVLWFECANGFTIARDMADRAIVRSARKNAYNPAQEWILSMPPESPKLFDGLAAQLFGSPSALYDTFLRKFMMAAVRRLFGPGEKVDNVLVLQSPNQGAHKSQFVEALFSLDWSIEDIPEKELGHKDNSQALATTWGVELAELDKLLRAQNDNSIKNFLSRRVDTYRASYGRHMLSKPRQCVFVGTTNETDFLRDPSGSRRFWCIPVPEGFEIPSKWVRDNRHKLWAAAYRAALTTNGTVLKLPGEYLEHEQHWLTPAEELARGEDAERFGVEDVLADPVLDECKGKEYVKLPDVLRAVKISDPSVTEYKVIASLKRLGARKTLKGVERERVWAMPPHVAAMQPKKPLTFGGYKPSCDRPS